MRWRRRRLAEWSQKFNDEVMTFPRDKAKQYDDAGIEDMICRVDFAKDVISSMSREAWVLMLDARLGRGEAIAMRRQKASAPYSSYATEQK